MSPKISKSKEEESRAIVDWKVWSIIDQVDFSHFQT